MKTTVSIRDKVFQEADRLARVMRKSRSELYTAAISEYLARHAPDAITEAANLACKELGDRNCAEPFVRAAADRILRDVQWQYDRVGASEIGSD